MMLENSRILMLCQILWQKYLHYYHHSVLYKIISAITGFIIRVWEGSLIRRVLMGEFVLENSFHNSMAGRVANGIANAGQGISRRLCFIVDNSALIGTLRAVLDHLLDVSCASYGLCFLVFGLPVAVFHYLNGNMIMMAIGLVAALLGIVLMAVRRSPAQLYNGSFIAKLAGGFFGLENLPERVYNVRHRLFFALLGAILAALACALRAELFIMAAGAIVGGVLVMYCTEIGIFAALLLMPLVPTMLVLGLCMITVLSFLVKVFITGTKKLNFNVIDIFVFLFAAMLCYSLVITYNLASSAVVVAVYLLFILFYYSIKNCIDSKEKLYAVLAFIAIGGALVALYGVYQKLFGAYIATDAWLDSEMFDETTTVRIYSTLENPNVLGEYLIFIATLAFSMLYYYKNYLYKFIGLCILGVSGLCMIYTQSRGAWLGLIFAFAIFVMLYDRRLIWLGVVGILAILIVQPESIYARITSIGDLGDSSTSYRVSIWMASLLMLKSFWPSGIGPGTATFMYIYHKYAYNAVYAPHSHNLYLQIMIDFGIIGLFVFIMYIVSYFKGLLSRIAVTKDKFIKAAMVVLCAGMAGYLLQGMTDNVWYNYRVTCFFWSVLGLGAAAVNISRQDTEETLAKDI